MFVLFARLFTTSIIPASLLAISENIKTPAPTEIYTANSGLYCLIITIKITAIKPNSYYFYNIHQIFLSHKLNIVLTVSNSVLISFIIIVRTIISPAKVVIIAWSSLPALTKTWYKTATNIPIAAILNNKSIFIFM